jgi:hypothetical protein
LQTVKFPGREEHRPPDEQTAFDKIPTREPHSVHLSFFRGIVSP